MKVEQKLKLMLIVALAAMLWMPASYANHEELLEVLIEARIEHRVEVKALKEQLSTSKSEKANTTPSSLARLKVEVSILEKQAEMKTSEMKLKEAELTFYKALKEEDPTKDYKGEEFDAAIARVTQEKADLETAKLKLIESKTTKTVAVDEIESAVASEQARIEGIKANFNELTESNSLICQVAKALRKEFAKLYEARKKSSTVMRVLAGENGADAYQSATMAEIEFGKIELEKLTKQASISQRNAHSAMLAGNEKLANAYSKRATEYLEEAQNLKLALILRAGRQGGMSMPGQMPMFGGGMGMPQMGMQNPMMGMSGMGMQNPMAMMQGPSFTMGGMQNSMMGGMGMPQMGMQNPMMGGMSMQNPYGGYSGTDFSIGAPFSQNGRGGAFGLNVSQNPLFGTQIGFDMKRQNPYIQDVRENGQALGFGQPDPFGGMQRGPGGFLMPDQNL